MNTFIDWFARNPVAANLLMVFLIVSGVFAGLTVKQEVFPEFSLDRVTIDVAYLGAAPEEVESAVTIRVEEAIQGSDGIKQITSTAAEGMATVSVELDLGADPRKVVDDIKSNVDTITTFPTEAEKPIIRELTTRQQVVDVAVSGPADELTLKRVAEGVRDDLAGLPEITQVEVIGARPYEIAIEVSEVALRRHGLLFDDVAARGPAFVIGSSRRLRARGGWRDSAPHDRSGVSGAAVRKPDAADQGGWDTAPARGCGDGG